MLLTFILAYLGGVLTIFSPCVLPVIPFVFSRADRPFRSHGLPMLIGMGLSFAVFALLSVVGGQWVVQANQAGRLIALAILAVLGLTLILPRLAERLMQPLVRLGSALQKRADEKTGIVSSVLLGASVGLLWAPCAGPILGLVLASASLGHSGLSTFILLLAFALGAGSSLAFGILAGSRLLRVLKNGLGAEKWIRRGLGVAVLVTVAAIALGLDAKLLAQFSYLNTNELEQRLIDRLSRNKAAVPLTEGEPLGFEGPMPSLDAASPWLNSPPLAAKDLIGKVVLVDFWTYSCINCLRTLPYLKAWNAKYRDQGLVIVGVHAPEFAFEKDLDNVRRAVRDLGISYPVAIDNDLQVWTAFRNRYWPAHYFVDAQGQIRHHHFGEGGYDESERVIQTLLAESHGGKAPAPAKVPANPVAGEGVEAPAAEIRAQSPET